MSTSRNNSQSGYLIILTMIVVFAMSAIALSIMATVSSKYATSARNLITENAVSAAEAGISDTVQQLNANSSFAGWTDTTNPRTFYDRGDLGKATYTTTVTPDTGDGIQTITSVAKVYRMATDPITSPASTKTVRGVVQKKQIGFPGSLVAGPGGLFMNNQTNVTSAKSLFVMGKILMGVDDKINSAANPASQLYVGNSGCGPAATWPGPCGSGSPPISLVNYAHNSKIYATTCATDQTDATDIVTLTPNCTAPITQMPFFDKKALINKIKAVHPTPVTAASINNQCASFGNPTVTVPANTWIIGDIYINFAAFGLGSCRLLFAGDTYIDGKLSSSLNGAMGVDNSAGTNRPTIMVNDQVNFSRPGTFSPWGGFMPNSSGTSAYVISFYSADPNGCSKREDTPSAAIPKCLTATQYHDSSQTSASSGGVSTPAIALAGNLPLTDLSGVMLYAYYGVIQTYNGNYKVGAVGGQGIQLEALGNFEIMTPDDSPFGQILTYPSYSVIDYQQLY
jgi:Tfp pilus assembly protein PilX